MAKINILPAQVYNRIAAGEVVERPASVVKELVENSIDAGATEIEIHIEGGGKQLICVVDNGCGIARDDLQSAFLPHATSKIAQAEDLGTVMTLGFRGEAIASIASVSKMTIASKTAEGKRYQLSCDGGEMGQITETSGPNGTSVFVEMLFYHTPVRLGFLKSDKGEETEITNLVSRFILNRSDIAFTYYINGKKALQSFGGGDEEAMACVYGASVLAECFCIDAMKHGVHIRGFIGNQNYYKANKSYQSVFLNGRYITNPTISAAITNAYSSYLMKRQYPFYVLYINVPREIVDVNVHPNKADVRFTDNQIVYGCIYSVISAVLDGQSKGLEYVVKAPQSILPAFEEKGEEPVKEEKVEETPVFSYEEALKEIEKSFPVFTAKQKGTALPFDENGKLKAPPTPPSTTVEYPPNPVLNDTPQSPWPYVRREEYNQREEVEKLHKKFPDLYLPEEEVVVSEGGKEADEEELRALPMPPIYPISFSVFEENKRFLEEEEKAKKQEEISTDSWIYVGKLFNTYLMYQLGDSVYFIDQHAAHERLLFDRLKAKMKERKVISQPMLIPYPIPVNYFEMDFLRENLETLREMGFTVECKDEEGVFLTTAVPMDLPAINLHSFYHSILAEINNYRKIKVEDIVKDKIASMACKAAVKAGKDLTQDEMDALFAMMDGDMTLKCPHGRPVVVKMTKREIEKKFKRIV